MVVPYASVSLLLNVRRRSVLGMKFSQSGLLCRYFSGALTAIRPEARIHFSDTSFLRYVGDRDQDQRPGSHAGHRPSEAHSQLYIHTLPCHNSVSFLLISVAVIYALRKGRSFGLCEKKTKLLPRRFCFLTSGSQSDYHLISAIAYHYISTCFVHKKLLFFSKCVWS